MRGFVDSSKQRDIAADSGLGERTSTKLSHCHAYMHTNQEKSRMLGRLGQGMSVARSQESNIVSHDVS